MNNLTVEPTVINDDNEGSKSAKKRISYASKDLASMVEFVETIYNKLGHTNYHTNKAIATVVGLSTDSIKMHLSSAQQYKLLELKHRVGYKITEHFQKLYLPKNDNEKRAAVIESLKNVETYQQLFKDYEYHTVPQDGVKNHFIRNIELKSDVAAKAAQVFIDNLTHFDLLDNRGVLTSGLLLKSNIDLPNEREDQNEPHGTADESDTSRNENELPARSTRFDKLIFQSELDAAGKKTIPIHLIGNKQAMFVYPEDITEDDIELVKHQIEGILLRIKLEAKRNNK